MFIVIKIFSLKPTQCNPIRLNVQLILEILILYIERNQFVTYYEFKDLDRLYIS